MRRFPPPNPNKRNGDGRWSRNRDRATQNRFRHGVLKLYGDRCLICGAQPVQAHHTIVGDNDPRTGRPLCKDHHGQVDPHAR
jgi:predicted restriction endonuclease